MSKRVRPYEPGEQLILCACGCGEIVPKSLFPSQQNKYINQHQHRGEHNGHYKGKVKKACPVCNETFYVFPAHQHKRVTCGNDECYRKWQGLTSAARGTIKVVVHCDNCGSELRLFPSQVGERNYCNRFCRGKHNAFILAGPKNGRWTGGKEKYIWEQVRIRDEHRCIICGFDLVTDIHHITPRANGGTDDFSNLITLCPNHHRMADLGIISVEHLRNTDWQPEHQADPTQAHSANR